MAENESLVLGDPFHLNESSLVDFFWLVPPARQIDLVRIAMSVYVIDRLVRRKKKIAGHRWPRCLQAQIEVLEPNFWNSDEIREALGDCLDFVSGDSWDFSFDGNNTSTKVDQQRFLPVSDDPPLLCLYSGGLDSAAGLSSRIAECPGRPVIPVTVWHQPRQKKLICEKQYPMLKERFGALLTPVVAKAAMIWSSELRKTKEERSQRSRSFLFATVVQPGESLEPIIDLLLRYRHEWLDLAAVGEGRGWSWTKLLGPTGSARYEGVSHASA